MVPLRGGVFYNMKWDDFSSNMKLFHPSRDKNLAKILESVDVYYEVPVFLAEALKLYQNGPWVYTIIILLLLF